MIRKNWLKNGEKRKRLKMSEEKVNRSTARERDERQPMGQK